MLYFVVFLCRGRLGGGWGGGRGGGGGGGGGGGVEDRINILRARHLRRNASQATSIVGLSFHKPRLSACFFISGAWYGRKLARAAQKLALKLAESLFFTINKT